MKNTKERHQLIRKHSSGDLHSRLKTRKLLGVGETDDGDVHRSKLSQILGHSEQLYVKLPRGLRIWQVLISIIFTVTALWALLFPERLFDISNDEDVRRQVSISIRSYGASLLSLSIVFWSTCWSIDRNVIRFSLMATIVYFTIQTFLTFYEVFASWSISFKELTLLTSRIVYVLLSYYYQWAIIGHKTAPAAKLRRDAANNGANLAPQSSTSTSACSIAQPPGVM